MKKSFILLLFIVLFFVSDSFAQTNWKTRFALNGAFYRPSETGHVHYFDNYTFEAGAIYKERLMIGVGAGYSDVRVNGVPRPIDQMYIPVYGDVKYYHPIFKWLKVFGGVEMGCDIRYLDEEIKNQTHLKSRNLFCYPQAGILLRLYKRLGIEVSYGYRYRSNKLPDDIWMPTISIVF